MVVRNDFGDEIAVRKVEGGDVEIAITTRNGDGEPTHAITLRPTQADRLAIAVLEAAKPT